MRVGNLGRWCGVWSPISVDVIFMTWLLYKVTESLSGFFFFFWDLHFNEEGLKSLGHKDEKFSCMQFTITSLPSLLRKNSDLTGWETVVSLCLGLFMRDTRKCNIPDAPWHRLKQYSAFGCLNPII